MWRTPFEIKWKKRCQTFSECFIVRCTGLSHTAGLPKTAQISLWLMHFIENTGHNEWRAWVITWFISVLLELNAPTTNEQIVHKPFFAVQHSRKQASNVAYKSCVQMWKSTPGAVCCWMHVYTWRWPFAIAKCVRETVILHILLYIYTWKVVKFLFASHTISLYTCSVLLYYSTSERNEWQERKHPFAVSFNLNEIVLWS